MFSTLIVLNVHFHYLTKSGDADFPEEWNSPSIISIPKKKKKKKKKKGDLSDCNNYRGISHFSY